MAIIIGERECVQCFATVYNTQRAVASMVATPLVYGHPLQHSDWHNINNMQLVQDTRLFL